MEGGGTNAAGEGVDDAAGLVELGLDELDNVRGHLLRRRALLTDLSRVS